MLEKSGIKDDDFVKSLLKRHPGEGGGHPAKVGIEITGLRFSPE